MLDGYAYKAAANIAGSYVGAAWEHKRLSPRFGIFQSIFCRIEHKQIGVLGFPIQIKKEEFGTRNWVIGTHLSGKEMGCAAMNTKKANSGTGKVGRSNRNSWDEP